jgi:non-specific serine/threonine protein kinase/serine/threonine-protein kinase
MRIVAELRLPTTPGATLPDASGFKILRLIGEGGMGTVYEAEQETPCRRVALKVIRGSRYVSEEQVRFSRREIESLGRLNHPSIAAIHGAGRTSRGFLRFRPRTNDLCPRRSRAFL